MKRIGLALPLRKGTAFSGWSLSRRKDRPPERHFGTRLKIILVAGVALSSICNCAFGQTTRTSPSASSTSKNIPSSSSTSPNSPCNPTNPTSPCYSANAPRDPCYSAATPNEPCSTTTTPSSPITPAPSPLPATKQHPTGRAFTEDQAKSKLETEGYSSVSGLRKDVKGTWRGKAIKDGLPVNVTLDGDGNVTAN